MRKLGIFMAAITLSGLLLAPQSFAQRALKWKAGGGWNPGDHYGRMYDPKTVETIRGEVVSVDRIIPQRGMSHGVHLTVKTERETMSVHLGPIWYITRQDTKIEPKDTVEVKGSRIMFREKPAIIAAEVKKGNQVLTLRDEDGFPTWSGWRRR